MGGLFADESLAVLLDESRCQCRRVQPGDAHQHARHDAGHEARDVGDAASVRQVNCISPFGVAMQMLVKAWRTMEEEDNNEIEFLVSLPTVREVEKTEEMVRGLANLKGATLTARDVVEAALYLTSNEAKYMANLVWEAGSLHPECVGFDGGGASGR
ncbi:short-chain dehydrogenase reductase 2a-like [Canna indica]|uniref:Short-chain dehydrogenase reductase 2a-like n=1 Tax=Canna indica TaxID=4628 RepID=A0AAQ3JMD5_9LILI|nr:short-chain dehydrogenase reductase 2a-like [Canna indica]